MKEIGRSVSISVMIGSLVLVGALAWAFLATAIDLSSDIPHLIENWADVPLIMRSRVPRYCLLVVAVGLASYLGALILIHVGGRRWKVAHLLLVIGMTWSSLFFLWAQLGEAAYVINPDEVRTSYFMFFTVLAGWVASITSIVLLLRRKRKAAIEPTEQTDRSGRESRIPSL